MTIKLQKISIEKPKVIIKVGIKTITVPQTENENTGGET